MPRGDQFPAPSVAKLVAAVGGRARRAMHGRKRLGGARPRLLVRGSPLPMLVTSGPDHVLEAANDGALALLGAPVEIGEPLRASLTLDALPHLDRAFASGQPLVAGELHVRSARGENRERLFDVHIQPLRNRRREVEGLAVVGVDVTDRVAARQKLEEERKWLEALLDRLPVALVLGQSATAQPIFVNRAAEALTYGYPRSLPPDGQASSSYATDRSGARIPANRMLRFRIARGEKVSGEEMTWHTPHGSVPMLLDGDLLPAMHGHEPTTVAVFQDIARLKQTELRLEEAVRARDAFLSLASHELKTPLTSLLLQLQRVRRRLRREEPQAVSPESMEGALALFERQTQRLARLVEAMLDASRLGDGRLPIERERFDMCELAREVAERMEHPLREAGCTLEFDLDACVDGDWDRSRCDQLLANLLSNACRHAPGPVVLSVHRDGPAVVLAVRDFGPGVALEDRERIFRRFECSTDGENAGLGMGLYIARAVAHAHGGSLTVEDGEGGRGARFVARLPMQNLDTLSAAG